MNASHFHYNDVIMSVMVSEITSLTIVYSTVHSGADQRKHQSSVSLAFVHRWPVNFPHQWPVTGKMFPFDDVIMLDNKDGLHGKCGPFPCHGRSSCRLQQAVCTERYHWLKLLVHGPEQISVPSGWAKLGNVFHVHIYPVHYLSHDRPLNSAAFMWLSPMLIILLPKNNIFVFFNDFQIIFKLKPFSMTVLIKYNCSNTIWYPFGLYVSISLKKGWICNKFRQKFLPFHNQWKIWTASLHLILRL